jgi:hypothetical protein
MLGRWRDPDNRRSLGAGNHGAIPLVVAAALVLRIFVEIAVLAGAKILKQPSALVRNADPELFSRERLGREDVT